MAVVVVIVLLALAAVLAAALGNGWGPAILALGFGGWALYVLLPGYDWPWPLFGIVYLALAIAELAAAGGFWSWQDERVAASAATKVRRSAAPAAPLKPPASWRAAAVLLGVGGYVGLFYQFGLILEASICAMTLDC